jgi:hypothetical protein
MAIKQVSKPLKALTMNQPSILLTITIGNGQTGGSAVRFEDEGSPRAKGAIQHLLLGDQGALQGRRLKIITTVLDSNIGTTNMVVTLQFQGTTASPDIITGSVDNNGDLFELTTEYQFN